MTLACADLDTGIAGVTALGYRIDFLDRNLPNHPSKTPFLAQSQPEHAIGFARADGALPIELVSYGRPPSVPEGRFCGVFAQRPPAGASSDSSTTGDYTAALKASGSGVEPTMCTVSVFDVAACFDAAGSAKGGLVAALLPTADLERARNFWQTGLGYREAAKGVTEEGRPWVRLRFPTPVANWRFDVVLVEVSAPAGKPLLDGRGMTCLSHVCSGISIDRQRLLSAGATAATEAFAARVNSNDLMVEILQGPDGEFIELMQVMV